MMMPHIDTLSLFTPWSASGQSRLARPVAAVSSFMRRLAGALGHPLPPARPRIHLPCRIEVNAPVLERPVA